MLFNRSIAENINYGVVQEEEEGRKKGREEEREGVGRKALERVKAAALAADVHEFIESLPEVRDHLLAMCDNNVMVYLRKGSYVRRLLCASEFHCF